MTTKTWKLLDVAVDMLAKGGFSVLPTSFAAALIDRLESALTGPSKDGLVFLGEAIAKFFYAVMGLAPAETRAAVKGEAGASESLSAAYLLGQISFAQAFAARAADRRADDHFIKAISDRKFSPIVAALKRSPLTNVDLATEIKETEASVSRKLGEMREIGICDFRREGRHVINFLSPAAISMETTHNDDLATRPLTSDDTNQENIELINELTRSLPQKLRSVPVMSSVPNRRAG